MPQKKSEYAIFEKFGGSQLEKVFADDIKYSGDGNVHCLFLEGDIQAIVPSHFIIHKLDREQDDLRAENEIIKQQHKTFTDSLSSKDRRIEELTKMVNECDAKAMAAYEEIATWRFNYNNLVSQNDALTHKVKIISFAQTDALVGYHKKLEEQEFEEFKAIMEYFLP